MKVLRSKKGFTLIELIIVIIIIGILAAVAIPKYMEIKEQAGDATAQGVLGALRGANSIVFAEANLKNWATTLAAGAALYDMTTIVGAANIQGIRDSATAGTIFQFTLPGAANANYQFGMATTPTVGNAAGVICVQARGGACANW